MFSRYTVSFAREPGKRTGEGGGRGIKGNDDITSQRLSLIQFSITDGYKKAIPNIIDLKLI